MGGGWRMGGGGVTDGRGGGGDGWEGVLVLTNYDWLTPAGLMFSRVEDPG